MARASLYLGLAMAIGGPSCLVTQSVEFPVPDPLGPFIAGTTPPSFNVIPVEANPLGATPTVATPKVTVRSEDVGRQLYIIWYEDYSGSGDRYNGRQKVPAGTFAEPRDLDVKYTPTSKIGDGKCHWLTALVTYDYDPFEDKLTGSAAFATWLLSYRDPNDPSIRPTLDTCHAAVSGAPPADGGPDGQ